MLKVGIILGSTRPGREGEAVAKWVHAVAQARGDADYRFVDLREQDLTVGTPAPSAEGPSKQGQTKRWAETVDGLDAFIFVTPEDDDGPPAALKDAIDSLFEEWHDKAAGFVSHGSAGGVRAVQALRPTVADVKMADVRTAVALSLFQDFEEMRHFMPRDFQKGKLNQVLDEVVGWGTALRGLRKARALEKERQATLSATV